jgi:prepilin-type N-terminal cleavage/methylation domain-containing protein
MKPLPTKAGFSLVEVLCAILLLGVGVAGLTHGVSTALATAKQAELQTTAALLAAGVLEELRAQGDLEDGETEGEAGENLPLYRWRREVSRTPIDGLHEVVVVVEHTRSGRELFELRTLLFAPSTAAAGSSSGRRGSKSEPKERRP